MPVLASVFIASGIDADLDPAPAAPAGSSPRRRSCRAIANAGADRRRRATSRDSRSKASRSECQRTRGTMTDSPATLTPTTAPETIRRPTPAQRASPRGPNKQTNRRRRITRGLPTCRDADPDRMGMRERAPAAEPDAKLLAHLPAPPLVEPAARRFAPPSWMTSAAAWASGGFRRSSSREA